MTDTVEINKAAEIAARLLERLGPAPSLIILANACAGGMRAPNVEAWSFMWHRETPSLNICTEERVNELARTTPLGLA